MNEPKSRIVHDEWDTYVAHGEDGPIFISYDCEAARVNLTDALPFCARVIVPIRSPNGAGGPDEPEAEILWAIEDELCDGLADAGVECRLVARLTYAGDRELVFHLADWESFRPPVGLWMMQHGEYEVDVSEHEGWEFYDDVVRPSFDDEVWMADSRVVESLLKAGSDPEKPHAIEYVFVGSAEHLQRAAAALEERGYRRSPNLDTSEGQIVMVIELPLDSDLVSEQSIANHRLADEYGVECDGWGAAVVS